MTSPHPTIVAESVGKSFGTGQRQTIILRGVSLRVMAGEVVFLVGLSGSGECDGERLMVAARGCR